MSIPPGHGSPLTSYVPGLECVVPGRSTLPATGTGRPRRGAGPRLDARRRPRPSGRSAGLAPYRDAARRSVRGRREHVFVSDEAAILHADLDAFYASVEQRDDPGLRGRPVIVGGGVVLAASYEATAYGVHSAMGGRQAARLCPHAIVVPPRFSAYSEASKAVYRVFD